MHRHCQGPGDLEDVANVHIDATIVRSILVPRAMALLGDRNWYLPAWLRWLPDLWVENTPAPAAPLLPISVSGPSSRA